MVLKEESSYITKKKAINKIINDIRSVGRGGTAGRNYFKYYVISDDGNDTEKWTLDVRYDPKAPIGERVQTRFTVTDKNTGNKPVYYDWTLWGRNYHPWTEEIRSFLDREIGKSF